MAQAHGRHIIRYRVLCDSVFKIMFSRYLEVRDQRNDTENQITTNRDGDFDIKCGARRAAVDAG